MEHPGHLEGMLDRDQRTAKLRFFNESDIKPVPKTYSFQDKTVNGLTPAKRHCYCPTRTKRSSSSSTNSSHLACRNGYLLNTFQSVKNVLIVVCLTLVTLPSASSAPVDMETRMNSKMKWVNPCDINLGGNITDNTKTSEFTSSEINATINEASDALNKATTFSESFSKVIVEATSALDQAAGFWNDFATQTFGKEMKDVHSDFKNQNYTWLELDWLGNKHLNENITEDRLEKLKIDEVLLNVYGILQRLAVGLEQVTWDQEDNSDKFENDFATSQLQVKRLLCELYQVIDAHGLEMPANATRDIMSEGVRKMDSTARKIRDWIIFRDYMNTLQFLKQALEYLNGSTKTSEG